MSKGITPKDALEGIIWRLTSHEDDLELRETDKKEIEIIKQALDRLELFEKENQDLKDNETIVADYGIFLWNENEKCKKVLNFLKEKVNIRVHILTNNDGSKIYEIEFILGYYSTIYDITQQEYDLLKEVLESC